ncbi:MAG TPA: glycosyltransferase [Gemmatimonadales bacterium]|nr:glycosyltransferase [Gemmatimonadales bacterium]
MSRSSADPVTPPCDGRLRVLVAHNAYQHRGGEDGVVEAEVSLLRARGHTVELYLRQNDELHDMGAWAAAKDTVWSSRTGADVARLVADFQPHVIHVHNTFALISPSVYAAAASARVPVVQTLHNFRLLCLQAMFLREGRVCEDCLGGMPWRGVLRRCYRGSAPQSAVLAATIGLHRAIGTYRKNVSRYIALTEFSRTKFMAGGLPGERISVKSNFADLPVLDHRRIRTGALFVGRLAPEKGTQVLARAAATRLPAVIDVIGAGPERSSLEAGPGIRLLGSQTPQTVYAKMREAAYLVVPSVCYENFPLTVVEAFANGLPVIASRLGAMAELVRDGETGVLFEAGSAEDLARTMAWADAHPGDMTRMGRAARDEYELKYTPDRNYAALMDIYRAAITTMQ